MTTGMMVMNTVKFKILRHCFRFNEAMLLSFMDGKYYDTVA